MLPPRAGADDQKSANGSIGIGSRCRDAVAEFGHADAVAALADADGDTCNDDSDLATDAAAVALDDAARLTVERLVATSFGTCLATAAGFGGELRLPDAGLVQKSAKKSASTTRGKRSADASGGGNAVTDEDAGADDTEASVDGGIEGGGASASVAVSGAQNESKNSDASCRLALRVDAAANGVDTWVKDGCDGDEDCTKTVAAVASDGGIEKSGRAVESMPGAQNESKNKSSACRDGGSAAVRGLSTALVIGAVDDKDNDDAEESGRVEGGGAAFV